METLRDQWKDYETLLPFESLETQLAEPVRICGQAAEFIIPSLKLGPDGVFVSSVFFVTKRYICELRIGGPAIHFDFVSRNNVINIVFVLNTQAVEREGAEKKVFETANVAIVHFGFEGGVSGISYVGSARDKWLKHLTSAFPVSSLLDTKPLS